MLSSLVGSMKFERVFGASYGVVLCSCAVNNHCALIVDGACVYMCTCVHVYAYMCMRHGACIGVKGQFMLISSLFLSCGLWGLDSGC